MPLKRGSSNKTVGSNIKELAHSPGHQKRVRQQGAAKAHEMEVAIAEKEADKSRRRR